MEFNILTLIYLIASVSFIIGLKMLSHPLSAILGSIVGTFAAKRVKMTAMPEMVSLFNGMGGACAALISLVEFDHLKPHLMNDEVFISDHRGMILVIVLGLIIGSISFAGSMIAWGKLNGKIGDKRR